jgi:hypothetical protein
MELYLHAFLRSKVDADSDQFHATNGFIREERAHGIHWSRSGLRENAENLYRYKESNPDSHIAQPVV